MATLYMISEIYHSPKPGKPFNKRSYMVVWNKVMDKTIHEQIYFTDGNRNKFFINIINSVWIKMQSGIFDV